MISFANSLKAIHSASAVDKATMLACSEHHRMGIRHKNKMKAMKDCLLSFSLAKSLPLAP